MIANKPMKHSELRKTIQLIIKSNGVKAYNHFNQGQNYTRKKGVVLNQLLEEWLNPSKKAPLPKQTIKKLDIYEINSN